jgi:hypothetical protein
MAYPSYMQIKDSAGGNIFEMKGWRWGWVLNKEFSIDPLKSFPGASSVNETLAVDFGKHTRDVALSGRLLTQRQFNTLKDYMKNQWFSKQPNTLTIGTGGTAITRTGIASHMHAVWNTKDPKEIRIDIDFLDVDSVWKI